MQELFQFGYDSEWALAKFLSAIFENGSSEFFRLCGVCGIEPDSDNAKKRLLEIIESRTKALRIGKNWRIGNIMAEIRSGANLLEKLNTGEIAYYPSVNGDLSTLPKGDYNAVIMTKNTTHLDYIRALTTTGKNILCEKPLCVLTNENHEANREQLDLLEEIIEKSEGLVLMDAEHYSSKKATITLYERILEMSMEYGRISEINAITIEKDDPRKKRTKKLLSRKNQTGLLTDMGVHLFGVITNIGGVVNSIDNARYGIFPGFNVETYVEAEFGLKGVLFNERAKGKVKILKFADRLKDPENEDKKQFEITFKDDTGKETKVTLDFNKGTVIGPGSKLWLPSKAISTFEYSNILNEFYDAISRGIEPRTSFRRSVKTLDTIYRIYKEFPISKRKNKIKPYHE